MNRFSNSDSDGGRRPTRPAATAPAPGQGETGSGSDPERREIPTSPARSGQCALCQALIVPPLIATAQGKALNFGAIDPMADAIVEHIAKEHAEEMQHILMAATLLTMYLSTAFLAVDWPEWDQTREQMHAGLELIFTSADAEPAPAEDVAKRCAGTPGANG